MTTKVPQSIQQEIQYHLQNHDPESAKYAYDQWMMKNGEDHTEKEELIPSSIHDDDAVLF